MRISLLPPRIDPTHTPPAQPLLDPDGAATILGAAAASDGLAAPIVPAPHTVFGPRGAALVGRDGPLIVADTGHHRLLIWKRRPREDHAPADLVIGQPGFAHEGRNGKGEVGATTLNVPTGLATGAGILAVADAWNHRVLIWHSLPTRTNQPADVVLGQSDAYGALANRGAATASAETLNWCYGIAIHDGKLFVADTGNRRVLVWDTIPERHGAPADLVLGQSAPDLRDENAGAAAGAVGMRWPHGIAVWRGELLVSDAGNNRIMGWRAVPSRDGTPCDYVLGQATVDGVDHNQSAYYPTANALNMPYGIAILGDRLAVADTASSRLAGFASDALVTNGRATWLAGQYRFCDKGDNRWGPATRNSVCWPYSIAGCGSTAIVADSGNNRVLLWEAA